MSFISPIKTLIKKLSYLRRFVAIQPDVEQISYMLHYDFLQRNLYENPKYENTKKLNKYEFQVYSQSGEDGILAEIFNRINTTNKVFVEFGVGNGLQNNTTYLLMQNWSGYWIDGNADYIRKIQNKFDAFIKNKRLTLMQAIIKMENIESLFDSMNLPGEFDLLSIDIDGNDYWIWKAIENYRPRVVVVEYNAAFPPPTKWVMDYQANYTWDKTQYFGASLKSLEILADKKGYKLVASSFSGVNAFFVRDDLVDEHFLKPFSAENHYESPKYYIPKINGHPKNIGPFQQI